MHTVARNVFDLFYDIHHRE